MNFPKIVVAIGFVTVIATFAALIWDIKASLGLDQHSWAKPNKSNEVIEITLYTKWRTAQMCNLSIRT